MTNEQKSAAKECVALLMGCATITTIAMSSSFEEAPLQFIVCWGISILTFALAVERGIQVVSPRKK